MSEGLAKEQRRHLRREIGGLAAAAMAEAKADVMKVRTAHLQMLETIGAIDQRTRQVDEKTKAALKLGFDNEQKIGLLERLTGRVEELEWLERQRQRPWWRRWFGRRGRPRSRA